jgi:peptidoglycan LD-endopeptidase CwlK
MTDQRKYIYIGLAALAAGLIVWKRKIIWYYIKLPLRMANDLNNAAKIEQLHVKVRPIFSNFIQKIKDLGWDVRITSGYRTFQEQDALHKENASNGLPGRSWHNYGASCDINAEKDGKLLRKASSIAEWEASGIPALAKSMGLKWGGLFTTYHDPIHFEFPLASSIQVAYDAAIKQFGSVEKAQGNQVRIA